MADIKIDETRFNVFMNEVRAYIEKTKSYLGDDQSSAESIIGFIDDEMEIRSLRISKDLNYSFYMKNMRVNKVAADKAYEEYKKADFKLKRLMQKINRER